MPAKKIFATFLLILGVAAFTSGLQQYRSNQSPNHCVISFAKSLGGRASFALDQQIRYARYFGISKIVGGSFFVVAGVFILLKKDR